jgi:putative heme iron utilization protein
VQFVDEEGAAMFKVFVRRDEAREMLPEQLARFEALKSTAG